MRVSTRENDPGYKNLQDEFYSVSLDGVEIPGAYTADEGLGYVLAAVEPLQVVDGEIVAEELYGTVVITKI